MMQPERVTSMLYIVPYAMSRAVPALHLYHRSLGVLLVTSQIYHGYGDWRTADTLVTNSVLLFHSMLLVQCRQHSWMTALSTVTTIVATVVHCVVRPRRTVLAWWWEPLMHVALAAAGTLYLLETRCRR